MPRNISSVKEHIAVRTFRRHLHEHLLEQSLNQGEDFGTDGYIKVFNGKGEPLRLFAVQIKYAGSVREIFDELLWEWRFQPMSLRRRLAFAVHDLSLEKLAQYTNPQVSGGMPTLFFLANDSEYFYCWINDLDKYYLRWLPRET